MSTNKSNKITNPAEILEVLREFKRKTGNGQNVKMKDVLEALGHSNKDYLVGLTLGMVNAGVPEWTEVCGTDAGAFLDIFLGTKGRGTSEFRNYENAFRKSMGSEKGEGNYYKLPTKEILEAILMETFGADFDTLAKVSRMAQERLDSRKDSKGKPISIEKWVIPEGISFK